MLICVRIYQDYIAFELLYQFKGTLPPSASMAHINIKTQKNDDWFDQHDALKLGQSLDDLDKDFDASILLSKVLLLYSKSRCLGLSDSVNSTTFFGIAGSFINVKLFLAIITLESLSRVAIIT
jgi:hypothetical protein